MTLRPISLGSQSNKGKYAQEGVARLINCRAEVGGDEQAVKWPIRVVEGQTSFTTLPLANGGVRGMIEVDGSVYVVAGRRIYRVTSGGAVLAIGAMPSDGLVTMARNARGTGAQIGVVCDGNFRIITGGSVAEVTDPDIGVPNSICTVGNHFLTSSADGYLRASEINDGTDWDGLDITEAQSSPDGLLRVMERGNGAVAFGARSFEVYDYDGEANGFPFRLSHSARVGAWSAGGIVSVPIIRQEVVTDTIAWVASDKDGAYAGVVMLNGVQAGKISIPSVDRDMASASVPADIRACTYTINGQAIIAWTIPGVTTWEYNTSTGLWNERQSHNSSTWNVSTTAMFGNRLIAGDKDTGTLTLLQDGVGVEGGNPLVMTVQTPPLHAYPDRVELNALYLDCVAGVGFNTTTAADLDPVVMMQMSRDGETWSSEIRRAMGRQAQTQTRLAWHGLGTTSHTGTTFRLRCSANVVRSFKMAQVDAGRVAA